MGWPRCLSPRRAISIPPVDKAVSAQSLYGEMLRAEVGPRLRAIGFVGSGSSFVLPDDESWLVVGFQKDVYSSASSVRFTVNLSKVRKAAWADFREENPGLARRPSGNTAYFADSFELIRLGSLMQPRGFDRWWQVKDAHPNARVAAQIATAIERLGVRWLQSPHDRPAGY